MKLFFCLVVSAVALAQTPVTSILTSTSNATFGMVGIASGQTARVNALSLASGGPIVAGSSCQVTASFFDENGKTLQTGTLPVGQGHAVHFDLATSNVPAGPGPVEIRATVSASFILPPTAATSPVAFSSCSILPTMEIFDQATGRTSVLLDNPRAMPTVLPLALETVR